MPRLRCLVTILFCLSLVTLAGCGDSTVETPKAWSTAERVVDTSLAPVVAGGGGITLMVWQAPDGIYFRQAIAGGEWSSPKRLFAITGSSGELKLAMNSRGEGLLTWRYPYGGLSGTFTFRYHPGTGWDTYQILQGGIDGYVSDLDISLGDDGTAYLAAVIDGGKPVYATERPGEGWSSVNEVVEGSPYLITTSSTRIVADATGGAHLVWIAPVIDNGTLTGNLAVYASHYTRSSGWSSPQVINTPATDVGGLSLAADGNGNAIAVWKQTDTDIGRNGPMALYSIRFCRDTGWDTAIAQDDGTSIAGTPSVVMNRRGDACIVWIGVTSAQDTTGRGSTSVFQLIGRRYTINGGWEPPVSGEIVNNMISVSVSGQTSFWPADMKVVAGSGSEFITTWSSANLVNNAIIFSVNSSRLTGAGTWTDRLLQDYIPVSSYNGDVLATDGLGNVTVAWGQEFITADNTISAGIFASRYR